MARQKKYHYDRHVRLHEWLMKTAAWKSLSPQARVVLIEIYKRYDGSNNGRIVLSVREAARDCNISKDTAVREFKRLQERGFTELKTPGCFSRKVRHASEWLLTEHRDDVANEMPKKTFVRWRANPEHGPNSGTQRTFD